MTAATLHAGHLAPQRLAVFSCCCCFLWCCLFCLLHLLYNLSCYVEDALRGLLAGCTLAVLGVAPVGRGMKERGSNSRDSSISGRLSNGRNEISKMVLIMCSAC
jgi:hypothetical protein